MKSIGNESPDLTPPVPLGAQNNYFLIPQRLDTFSEPCDSQGWINLVMKKRGPTLKGKL